MKENIIINKNKNKNLETILNKYKYDHNYESLIEIIIKQLTIRNNKTYNLKDLYYDTSLYLKNKPSFTVINNKYVIGIQNNNNYLKETILIYKTYNYYDDKYIKKLKKELSQIENLKNFKYL